MESLKSSYLPKRWRSLDWPSDDFGGAEHRAVRVLALLGTFEEQPELHATQTLGRRDEEEQQDAYQIQRSCAQDACSNHAAACPADR